MYCPCLVLGIAPEVCDKQETSNDTGYLRGSRDSCRPGGGRGGGIRRGGGVSNQHSGIGIQFSRWGV